MCRVQRGAECVSRRRRLGKIPSWLTRAARSIFTDAVISGSWDQTLRITPIDRSTSQPSPNPIVLRLPHKVYSLALSRTKLVCAMGARHVWIWDIEQLKRAIFDEGKTGDEIEPWQRRESSLKFMTRAVRIMHNDQGEWSRPTRRVSGGCTRSYGARLLLTRNTGAWKTHTGYVTTSIEGRVAVEFFDPSPAAQAKKYAFKCHRQVIDGVDTVYPVQGLAFNPA